MAIVSEIISYAPFIQQLAANGTYETIAAAVESGAVQIVGESATGGLAIIEGGAASEVISFGEAALEVARRAELAATPAKIESGAVTLLKTANGFRLGGLMSLELPVVAAAAAPIAGFAIGEGLYELNPKLWTKISQTLLPFAYDDNKIQAFLDFVVDTETQLLKPIVTIPTAIINALSNLLSDGDIALYESDKISSPYGSVNLRKLPDVIPFEEHPSLPFYKVYGNGYAVACRNGNTDYVYCTEETQYRSAYYGGTYRTVYGGNGEYPPGTPAQYYGIPYVNYTPSEIIRIINNKTSSEIIPPSAGVEAPSVPVEPVVWPNFPIIIVPDPLGPDYQPIPVTPITPLPLPAPEPVPLLPAPTPEPTTPEKPDNWPEEDPWPTVIPFPVQPTEPDPDWPVVIPWPLPPEEPENWPTHPEPWEWPEELPWPREPDDWPEEVPWPEDPPDPETWPEEIPWPESPDEWPEEVPWPTPWPEEWPEDQPWPVEWPEEVPYPIPFPYPDPSQDPYPDPENIPEPDRQVDPYIDPWPVDWPDPYNPLPTNPDPTRDPTIPDKTVDIDDPSDPDPDQYPPDAYPTPPQGIPIPPILPMTPLPFSITDGIISVYHPTTQQLFDFARWLWVTWSDATIDKIWNNPFDGVITLFELYCTPTDVGQKTIRSGFLDSGITSNIISRYTELDCGSIGVPEYFGNYFDYSPYSKCHIYLPFVGIVEVSVDDIVGHGVNITYRIDEYNGSCIAMITCAKHTVVNGTPVEYSTIVYQFSGNCAVELPLSGGSQAAIRAGMIEAAAGGIGSFIGGLFGGTISSIGQGLAYGASSAVKSAVSAKSSVQHSGSFGASYGAMGAKKPYIIVTRPKQIQVANYNELYGYQAHARVRIGDCTGYLRCEEVHVISPTASDEEKMQIEQLLKTGVYITE